MTPLGSCLLSVPAGALLGALQLSGLRRDVRRYLGTGVRAPSVLLHGLRLLVLSAAFLAFVPLGAPALIGALVGWTLLRSLWLRRAWSPDQRSSQ